MKQKMMILLLAVLPFIGSVRASGQDVRVSGIVISAEDNETVIGATVRGKTSNKGAATDIDGRFSFNVPATEKTLIVSYIGMQPKDVNVGQDLRIVLEPETSTLDEVVVVAYGTAKKQSLVGAQSNVTAKQLEARPLTNVTNALSGMAPGVQVTSAGGQPGSGSSVRIRGFGSVNASSAPIYVVDGAIYNGPISDIQTSDIRSISILKDAASTALYGSSAGNGVILITTKSGTSNMGKNEPTITFSMSQGFSRRGKQRYETVGAMDYLPLRWQQWYNQYHYSYGLDPDQATLWANTELHSDILPQYMPFTGIKTHIKYVPIDAKNAKLELVEGEQHDGIVAPYMVNAKGELNPEVTGLKWGDDLDWESQLFRTGIRSDYNVNIAWANDKVRSFVSAGYLKEEGYRIKTGMERFSGRANVSYNVNKYLETGMNIGFSRKRNTAPKQDSGYYSSNSFNFIQNIAPIYPIHLHQEDGSLLLDASGNPIYDHSAQRPYVARFNPIEESELDLSLNETDGLVARTFATIKFMPELKLTTNIGYDLYANRYKIRYNNRMGDQPSGYLEIGNGRHTTLTLNQLLNYSKDFGELHHLDLLLGHESYHYQSQTSSMGKKKMSILGMDEMSNLSDMSSMGSTTNTHNKEGYFFRANYDYSDKYNVSVSYRRDGSSRFAKKYRWGNFWSIGAGWNIAGEAFMSDLPFINLLKLRASIGQTGNDDVSSYYPYATFITTGANNFGAPGLKLGSIGNPALVWETQTSYDLALEFRAFNRISGTLEFFNKESKDLIFPFPLVPSSGETDQSQNLGKVRNYGLEFDLNYDLIQNRDLTWSIGLNGTILKNKIVRLPEPNRADGIEMGGSKKYVEGGSMYDFYLTEYRGVDPDDGMAMFTIDDVKYPNQADPTSKEFAGLAQSGERATMTKDGRFAKKHFAGSSIPNLYGGFNTRANYKGVDLGLVFAYRLGGKSYDSEYQNLMGRSLKGGKALHVDMKKAWRQPGQITDIPRLDAGDAGKYDNENTDFYLISGSALMLKSINIGYTLPNSWTERLLVKNVRISMAGENLFLWSKRKGLNPFSSFGGVAGAAGYSYAKTFTTSLSFNL